MATMARGSRGTRRQSCPEGQKQRSLAKRNMGVMGLHQLQCHATTLVLTEGCIDAREFSDRLRILGWNDSKSGNCSTWCAKSGP
eukprot:gene3863-biopygen1501